VQLLPLPPPSILDDDTELLTRIVGADTGEGLGELVGDGGGALDFEGDASVEAEAVMEEDVKESLGEKQQGAGGGGGVLDGTRQQLEEEAKVRLADSSWLVGS
jgi:hypothetical protein